MIFIIEPQCYGLEHAQVNAALLTVIRRAFPGESILFFSELHHLDCVRNIALSSTGDTIKYEAISCPNRFLSDARRLPGEWKLVKKLFISAKILGCSKIIYASVTSPGLWCIKILVRKYKGISVFVIPHSILESIITRPSLKPWNFIFWFRFSLLIGNWPQLHFLLYGESIRDELCRILPNIQDYVHFINHPYLFSQKYNFFVDANAVTRFGAFGYGQKRKRTDLLFKLAADVHRKTSKAVAEFYLIGQISDPIIRVLSTEDVIIPSPDKPLSRELFDEYANSIDYTLFFYDSKSHRLTASGTFYDAMSYIKPIIALKTPFFDYYFKKFGDIGYLCNDYEELLRVVLELIHIKPTDRYTYQCNNIVKAREIMGIDNHAIIIRKILG